VAIRIDAFPGLRLQGTVDSIQRGTGAQFALLPPENATGNFVKVVQRVPVKINFDNPGEALRWISPGMSVEAKIYTAEPPRLLSFLD
jgi:membrane fusion protein (multidrug efflux system)